MKIRTIRQDWTDLKTDRLALGVFDGPSAFPETPLGALVTSLLANKEAPVEIGTTLALHGVTGTAAGTVVLFGLGARRL